VPIALLKNDCYNSNMKTRTKIILPIVIFLVGVVTVFIGRQGEISADVTTQIADNSIYVFLMAAGFLLMAVAAIVALFAIASSEKK